MTSRALDQFPFHPKFNGRVVLALCSTRIAHAPAAAAAQINSIFLRELEAEHALSLADGRAVRYGPIIFKAAKQFRGCYTRYVNNYDQAERHLNSLKTEDKEKHRRTDAQSDGEGSTILSSPAQRVDIC
eukprot:4451394-Pleurochrysis_carterae.AAC.1